MGENLCPVHFPMNDLARFLTTRHEMTLQPKQFSGMRHEAHTDGCGIDENEPAGRGGSILLYINHHILVSVLRCPVFSNVNGHHTQILLNLFQKHMYLSICPCHRESFALICLASRPASSNAAPEISISERSLYYHDIYGQSSDRLGPFFEPTGSGRQARWGMRHALQRLAR